MNNALYRVFTISKTFVDRTKDGALYLLKEYFYKNTYYKQQKTTITILNKHHIIPGL